MIIDQFGVFFDDEAAAASMTSKVVNVQPYAGREDGIYISLLAKGANSAAADFTVTVEESADNTTFSAVGQASISKPDALPVLKAIRLPVETRRPFVRLSVAVTGDDSGVTLFAAVTRDHYAPYNEGLYIDRGKVVA